MKSSREQFEEWVPAMVDGLPENMARIFEDMLFTAWQSSRAAIEVELPGSFRESYQSSNMVIDEQETIERIESQGLKVKS